MHLDIKVASADEISALRDIKGSRSLAYGDFLAPISPGGAEGHPFQLSTEGIGSHGAYEDSVSIDMTAPVINGGFRFLVDYPLDHPALITVLDGDDKAFSMQDLIAIVKAAYEGIYHVEDGGEDVPDHIESNGIMIMNRPQTNGVFGISMHTIHDLAIEGLRVIEYTSGERSIYLEIGS